MKIDRLIGIITLLLRHEKLTAPELAARFEVSRRTINRDIEDICKAGIPVVTTQGANGGITILDSYKIDKTLFTPIELGAVLAGLSTLHSISDNNRYHQIMEKFSKEHSYHSSNHLLIDLSSHYKETLAPQIALLETCIDECCCIQFTYFNQNGQHLITLEPYFIVFQWSSWYVFGHNTEKEEFRLYKLRRMTSLTQLNQFFTYMEPPAKSLEFDKWFTDEIHAVIYFDESQRFHLLEEYGESSFREEENGRLKFSFTFTNEEYLIRWVLSFGEHAELIEPSWMRAMIQKKLTLSLSKYEQ